MSQATGELSRDGGGTPCVSSVLIKWMQIKKYSGKVKLLVFGSLLRTEITSQEGYRDSEWADDIVNRVKELKYSAVCTGQNRMESDN